MTVRRERTLRREAVSFWRIGLGKPATRFLEKTEKTLRGSEVETLRKNLLRKAAGAQKCFGGFSVFKRFAGRELYGARPNGPREAGDSVLVKTDRGLHERATRERKNCRDTKLDTGTRN